ncbi:MAG: hypothetical protein WC514_03040 [Candidatus Paceibacterota bacterium]
MIKKTILFLAVMGVLIPAFSLAQNETATVPENWEEIKDLGQKGLEQSKGLPQILENIFKNDVLPVWEKMYSWFKTNILSKLSPSVQKEIEERKPVIKEEFQKEKEEIRGDLPNAKTTLMNLWQKIKEILK